MSSLVVLRLSVLVYLTIVFNRKERSPPKKPKIIESETSAVQAESVLGGFLMQLASMVLGAEVWDRQELPREGMLERTHAYYFFSSTISGSS